MNNMIRVFTDGSSTKNKNNNESTGGIGIYISKTICFSQSFNGIHVTNQRMELMACIFAIEKCVELYTDQVKIEIISDSIYAIKSATIWAREWEKANWKRGINGKYDICNLDLIKRLYELTKTYNVTYKHVLSHQKEPTKDTEEWTNWYGNKQADVLAKNAYKS